MRIDELAEMKVQQLHFFMNSYDNKARETYTQINNNLFWRIPASEWAIQYYENQHFFL